MPIFAKVGESHQVFSHTQPDGYIEMNSERPSVHHVAKDNGEWHLSIVIQKNQKLDEINSAYQRAIAAITPTYPDDERLTFDKQEQEARSWLADSSASTPFIDALAAGRQMDKAELVKRIIAKADAFALASGSLTGQRQRYEDLLKNAQDAEAVKAIVPEYSLPPVAGAQA